MSKIENKEILLTVLFLLLLAMFLAYNNVPDVLELFNSAGMDLSRNI